MWKVSSILNKVKDTILGLPKEKKEKEEKEEKKKNIAFLAIFEAIIIQCHDA